MENVEGGNSCGTTTGALCGATAMLLFSAVFAPLAGATGIGCAIGVYMGCHNK
jgi:hypothetical protein